MSVNNTNTKYNSIYYCLCLTCFYICNTIILYTLTVVTNSTCCLIGVTSAGVGPVGVPKIPHTLLSRVELVAKLWMGKVPKIYKCSIHVNSMIITN